MIMAQVVEKIQYPDNWKAWPVYWSAVWVGALAALSMALIFGLVGIALGAHLVGPADVRADSAGFRWGSALFCVFGAFLSFVVGGWVTGKVAGICRSEPAMLHGAVAWLVTVPLLMALGAAGAGSFFGSWYQGLAGTPAWASNTVTAPGPEASEAERTAYLNRQEELARAARNSAVGAVSALLLGLIGSVIGGWLASGEPMTFTYYRQRDARLLEQARAGAAEPETRGPSAPADRGVSVRP